MNKYEIMFEVAGHRRHIVLMPCDSECAAKNYLLREYGRGVVTLVYARPYAERYHTRTCGYCGSSTQERVREGYDVHPAELDASLHEVLL